MYWKSCVVIGGVFALNEHITVCPSSIKVDVPSTTTEQKVAVTLTNNGAEIAYLTLLPNDTFNNAREQVWRANESYAPMLIDDFVSTTTTTSTRKSTLPIVAGLSQAALRFENLEVAGHGVMIAHGNLESHPDLETITTARPPSVGGGQRSHRPRKYSSRGFGIPALLDWHKIVVPLPNSDIHASICKPKTLTRAARHVEVICPTILLRTAGCEARSYMLDGGEAIEVRFPASCTDHALAQAISIWTEMLGSDEAEADELMLVDGEYNLRGIEAAMGGVDAQMIEAGVSAGGARRDLQELSFDPNWPNEWQYGYFEYSYPFLMINATVQWPVLARYPIAKSPTTMVIDTYAQLNHEDLVMNYAVNEAELNGIKGVDDDGDGVIDNIWGLDGTAMEHGDPTWAGSIDHGTSVSGLISARPNNDEGTAGIAPNTRVLPCGTGKSSISMFGSIECLKWAYDNAKRFNLRVINHSYTGSTWSSLAANAYAKLHDIGMMHTIATGNTNRDLDELDPLTPLLYLATEGHWSLIGVARLNKAGMPAPSGYSRQWTSFYMPGELTLILPPDGAGIASGSGTSYAAPTAAGVIASMLTVRPELDVFDVLWILENSIVKYAPVAELCKWGGYVNASLAIENSMGTWIKPLQESDRYITLKPGESKTVDFSVTLQPQGFESANSRTAYIAVLGKNDTRLSGVYKMGEIPVTISLS